MNSRSGQVSTLTKSRVAPSWQESVFAINRSFSIQAIQWPPPPHPPNPNPEPQPFMNPEANPGVPDTSQPANNPSDPQQNPDPANPASI
ncbi:MAG TPA: hypothetical protein V6D25_02390 [Leptolyngbyaceae cyanobacterium]